MIEMEAGESIANTAVEASKDPHAPYVSKVEHEQVRQAIEQLPMKFREVILLREYEDLSYQEIASILECPVGTVMSRLGRARSKLRTALASALHKSANQQVREATESIPARCSGRAPIME